LSDSKLKNFIYILSGLAVAAAGLAGAGLGVLAIIDPAGSKLADDGDPFGPPPSRFGSAVIVLIFALIAAVGFWIISLADRKSSN